MTLYGDEDFIKGYSREAIEAILAYIGDDQQQWGTTSISWELLFEKSCELNAATIANSNDNNECLNENAAKLIAKYKGYTALTNGNYLMLAV